MDTSYAKRARFSRLLAVVALIFNDWFANILLFSYLDSATFTTIPLSRYVFGEVVFLTAALSRAATCEESRSTIIPKVQKLRNDV